MSDPFHSIFVVGSPLRTCIDDSRPHSTHTRGAWDPLPPYAGPTNPIDGDKDARKAEDHCSMVSSTAGGRDSCREETGADDGTEDALVVVDDDGALLLIEAVHDSDDDEEAGELEAEVVARLLPEEEAARRWCS